MIHTWELAASEIIYAVIALWLRRKLFRFKRDCFLSFLLDAIFMVAGIFFADFWIVTAIKEGMVVK